MNENTQNTGVTENVTETVVNVNPAPVATETVVKAKGAVGRPPKNGKLYLANEDGSIILENGVARRLGRGKPAAGLKTVYAIPSKKGAGPVTYTIVSRPVKVVKASAVETPAATPETPTAETVAA